jgi:hypothetical protein
MMIDGKVASKRSPPLLYRSVRYAITYSPNLEEIHETFDNMLG